MSTINFGRVVVGGLIAGVVLIVGEVVVHALILGEAWLAALDALGVTLSVASAFTWGVGAFIAGVVAVWVYASIRTRYGPGPRTALKAATAIWLVVYVLPCVGMMGMPHFPIWLLGFAIVWGFVEVAIAVLAGAWLYAEEAPAVA